MAALPVIVWFRRDLRLMDNPALTAAMNTGCPLITIYILDDASSDRRALGSASKWWLDKSLRALGKDIETRGGQLVLRRGDPASLLPELVDKTGATAVFWNRRYEQRAREADAALKTQLQKNGVAVKSFNANLLSEPWTIKANSGSHYKVFTPYWKMVRASYEPPSPLSAPDTLTSANIPSDMLDDWQLHPTAPDWSKGFAPHWQPGAAGALDRLGRFVSDGLGKYVEHRNRPDIETGTSGLSPHLAFGEISPAMIWRVTHQAMQDRRQDIPEDQAWTFLSEIAWREFSYVLLYHYRDLASENYNKTFDHMPWRASGTDYEKWCYGQTGYPIVDAGMRQLWQTGWMHNRVRMIVASFLTKHLLLPWQKGEDWFWDTLLDADPASNAASWQWTAGSGADAAPYFRVFNPITQGQKFDATGAYVRTYCPELADLPNKYLHAPWTADPVTLAAAGVTLGQTYPEPMVDHKMARQRALDAYETVKTHRGAN